MVGRVEGEKGELCVFLFDPLFSINFIFQNENNANYFLTNI